jgi:hypothetical protein
MTLSPQLIAGALCPCLVCPSANYRLLQSVLVGFKPWRTQIVYGGGGQGRLPEVPEGCSCRVVSAVHCFALP